MTLREPPSRDPADRNIPGADILDECVPRARKPRAVAKAAKATPASIVDRYTPTPAEAEAAGNMLMRRKTMKQKLDFTASDNTIKEAHAEPAVAQVVLADSFATANTHFSQALLFQLAGISGAPGESAISGSKLSQQVALVQGIGPRDEIEAMLAVQMVATHDAVMTSASSLKCAKTLPQQEAAADMQQKFARTFAAQIEALKAHRSTGEQHIHVHRHGFKTGKQGRGGCKNPADQSHEPRQSRPDEPSTPMLRALEALSRTV
jgi:hypothetical protein